MMDKPKGGRPPENKVPVTFRYNPEAPPYAALLKMCAARGWNVQRGLDELVNLWYAGQLVQAPPSNAQPATAPAEDALPAGAKLLADDYM